MKKEGKAYYRGNTYLLAGVRLQKVGPIPAVRHHAFVSVMGINDVLRT